MLFFFEVETPDMEETAPPVSWNRAAQTMMSLLLGTGEHLCRCQISAEEYVFFKKIGTPCLLLQD